MSVEEYRRWLETKEAVKASEPKGKKKSRNFRQNGYGAKRTEFAGRSFASALEANTYALLLEKEKEGLIGDIRMQFQVYLTDARIGYRVDFRVYNKRLREYVFVEAKGFEKEEWLLKKKLWTVYGPGRLEIYSSGKPYPKLKETIIPGAPKC